MGKGKPIGATKSPSTGHATFTLKKPNIIDPMNDPILTGYSDVP
jgi:hypothetical protein